MVQVVIQLLGCYTIDVASDRILVIVAIQSLTKYILTTIRDVRQ